jgi:hypothetical protein
MTRHLLAGLLATSVLAAPAFAAAPKPSQPEPGTSVEMPYLIAPLTIGDTLVAYAYVSSKIISSSQATAIDVRDKIPFIQDAFVRDVNGLQIGRGDNPPTIDSAVLKQRLFADVKKVMGSGKVAGIEIVQVQVTLLRPGAAATPTPPQ